MQGMLRTERAVILVCALLISSPAYAIPCWLIKLSYAPFAKQWDQGI
jgi:hypothetical protein